MTLPYGVVIPAFDAARTLAEAIESVLAQSVPAASIVVVDDGSTDDTAAIARSFAPAVRLISQPNRGPGAATDRGFAELSEPMLAGLDADDRWHPEKAGEQLAALAEVDAVFCHARVFDHGTSPGPASPTQALWGRSALMIRREAAERIGPVGDSRAGEMVDWLARGRELGLRYRLLDAALVDRRRIPGSLTYDGGAEALLPAVRAALERRRARQ